MNVYRCQLKELSDNENKKWEHEEIIDILFKEDRLTSFDDKELPKLFYEKFYSSVYPVWFSQALVNREFFTTTQVEDRNQPSSHTISFPIIEAILNLLNVDGSKDEIIINMFLRQGARIHSIPFTMSKPSFNISNISEKSNSDLKDLWYKTMNSKESFVETINSKFKMFFISLIYFWNNQSELTDRFALCPMYYHIHFTPQCLRFNV